MPVLVRNTQSGVTVLASDPKGTHFVEWQGANDPSGGDVQIVPQEVVDSVPFARAIQRGILVIENPEDNPEIVNALTKQNQAWRSRNEQALSDITSTIEQTTNNDVVSVPCVGPNTKGTGTCGVDVPVRDQDRNAKPPLCPQHEALASQYVSTETDEQGRKVTHWNRVVIGERERAQQ